MQTQAIEGKKKPAQPVWTAERRAKHRAGCKAAGDRYRQLEAEIKQAKDYYDNYPGGLEKLDELLELVQELRTQGIDPDELLSFATLVKKNNRDLTDDQGFKAHELLVLKLSAAEIYQQIFEVTA